MLELLLLAALQSVPGNITKVPRDSWPQPGLCAMDSTVSDLTAGTPYDLVFFVDAGVRYRQLIVGLQEQWGISHGFGVPVSDTEPLCTSGPNQGQRPHLVPLRVVAPGIYRVEAVIVNDPSKDGIRIDQQRITVR